MARSLIASTEGIKRAKLALKRRNLTQKALAYELAIASWATINKFFNGKPIDRSLFLEICETLDLNWQDIAVTSNEEEEEQLNLTPLQQLWQQLQALGSHTEEMGLVLVKEETLAWRWKPGSNYEKSVSVGSHIRFEVNLDTSGYLLLIQKDTSGEVWCFCPSCFAPRSQLKTGKTSLPQEGSPITSFPIEGEPGKEEILAVITQNALAFDWLPEENDEPLQLDESHFVELIQYINNSTNCQIFYTDYMIVE